MVDEFEASNGAGRQVAKVLDQPGAPCCTYSNVQCRDTCDDASFGWTRE